MRLLAVTHSHPKYPGDATAPFIGSIISSLARRGHVFKSSSDTEVLVHLYEEEGANLVRALRGIFAFAIYDRARCRLLLARDRYGVKPLFYAEVDGEWLFASEIKAIVARRGFVPRLDRQACYDFLGLGYVYASRYQESREPLRWIVDRLRGEKIYEVPVHYRARGFDDGKKLTALDGIRVLWTLLRCRLTRS